MEVVSFVWEIVSSADRLAQMQLAYLLQVGIQEHTTLKCSLYPVTSRETTYR